MTEQLRQPGDDGQPYPQAQRAVSSRVVDLVELLIDELLLFWRYADAGVVHFDAGLALASARQHQYSALCGVFDSVVYQIGKQAQQQLRVAVDPELGGADTQRQLFFTGSVYEALVERLEQILQCDRPAFGSDHAGIQA